MKTAAVIVAAGSASRMNGINKQVAMLGAMPVFVRSVKAFSEIESVGQIILVCSQNMIDDMRDLLAKYASDISVQLVVGGENRVQSVVKGIAAVDDEIELVAVHDGARPLVTSEKISEVIATAEKSGAAILAVPVKDTIKEVEGDIIISSPSRERLYLAETPQVFRKARYQELIQQGIPENVFDDSSIFELAGERVEIVLGDYQNIKITTPGDLVIAEAMLLERKCDMRIGTGYDVHRLVAGRSLILGGVEIPCEMGLLGHSDADVLVHAVMDSLLGALSLGDIGQHFPDSDERYRGADSIELAKIVVGMIHEQGYRVKNVDCVIVAERPRLAPHILAMRERLAEVLCVPVDAVSVKATTEEGLGLAGEGIAAKVVCLVEK